MKLALTRNYFIIGWLAGWAYRKEHTIFRASGAGTGYQISLYVMYGDGTDSGNTVYLGEKGQKKNCFSPFFYTPLTCSKF